MELKVLEAWSASFHFVEPSKITRKIARIKDEQQAIAKAFCEEYLSYRSEFLKRSGLAQVVSADQPSIESPKHDDGTPYLDGDGRPVIYIKLPMMYFDHHRFGRVEVAIRVNLCMTNEVTKVFIRLGCQSSGKPVWSTSEAIAFKDYALTTSDYDIEPAIESVYSAALSRNGRRLASARSRVRFIGMGIADGKIGEFIKANRSTIGKLMQDRCVQEAFITSASIVAELAPPIPEALSTLRDILVSRPSQSFVEQPGFLRDSKGERHQIDCRLLQALSNDAKSILYAGVVNTSKPEELHAPFHELAITHALAQVRLEGTRRAATRAE